MTTSKLSPHQLSLIGLPDSDSTSSLQGIPVSRFPTPGSDEARKMTATSGRGLLALCPQSGHVGACLKTLLVTCQWDSTLCCLIWKPKTTPAGRLLFRLQVSVPRIAEIESGLWGTPTSRDHKDGKMETLLKYQEKGKLTRQVANRMWPTPASADNRDRGNLGTPAIHRRIEKGKQINLGMMVTDQKGMVLNSSWVSRMMGYPDDWLTLDGEEIL